MTTICTTCGGDGQALCHATVDLMSWRSRCYAAEKFLSRLLSIDLNQAVAEASKRLDHPLGLDGQWGGAQVEWRRINERILLGALERGRRVIAGLESNATCTCGDCSGVVFDLTALAAPQEPDRPFFGQKCVVCIAGHQYRPAPEPEARPKDQCRERRMDRHMTSQPCLLDRNHSGDHQFAVAPAPAPAPAPEPEARCPDGWEWATRRACIACGKTRVMVREVGDHDDNNFKCTDCGKDWWVDGDDG